jgi:hypothetical protein
VEGKKRVNVIIWLYQTANRKGKSLRAASDSESENAAAYLRDLAGLAFDA